MTKIKQNKMSEQSARLYQRRPNYMTNLYSMWRLPHRRTEARFPEASKIKCSVNGNVHCSQTKTMHRNYQRKKKKTIDVDNDLGLSMCILTYQY